MQRLLVQVLKKTGEEIYELKKNRSSNTKWNWKHHIVFPLLTDVLWIFFSWQKIATGAVFFSGTLSGQVLPA